jgi:hypothetical protein
MRHNSQLYVCCDEGQMKAGADLLHTEGGNRDIRKGRIDVPEVYMVDAPVSAVSCTKLAGAVE